MFVISTKNLSYIKHFKDHNSVPKVKVLLFLKDMHTVNFQPFKNFKKKNRFVFKGDPQGIG